MARWFRTGVVLAMGLVAVPAIGSGQARRRNVRTRYDGHRAARAVGRTAGGYHPDPRRCRAAVATSTRPGGTISRETFIPRPGGGGFGGFRGWGPGPRIRAAGLRRWRRWRWDRSLGRGPARRRPRARDGDADRLGGRRRLRLRPWWCSSRSSSPSPARWLSPQPAPPVVEYVPPVRYQPQVQPVKVVDPVAQEIARFQSNHEGSRVDAAVHLGRIGDARAVMPLVDRLKNDRSRDVRVASATALGQIGDPTASVYLERAVIYDHRQEGARRIHRCHWQEIRKMQAAKLQAQPQVQAQAEVAASVFLGPGTDRAGFHSLTPAESIPPPPDSPPTARNAIDDYQNGHVGCYKQRGGARHRRRASPFGIGHQDTESRPTDARSRIDMPAESRRGDGHIPDRREHGRNRRAHIVGYPGRSARRQQPAWLGLWVLGGSRRACGSRSAS